MITSFRANLGLIDPTIAIEQVKQAAADEHWVDRFADEKELDPFEVWMMLIAIAAVFNMKTEAEQIIHQGDDFDLTKLRENLSKINKLDSWIAAEQKRRKKDGFPWLGATVTVGLISFGIWLWKRRSR